MLLLDVAYVLCGAPCVIVADWLAVITCRYFSFFARKKSKTLIMQSQEALKLAKCVAK